MKLSGGIKHRPRKNPFNFKADLNQGRMQDFFFSPLSLNCEIGHIGLGIGPCSLIAFCS